MYNAAPFIYTNDWPIIFQIYTCVKVLINTPEYKPYGSTYCANTCLVSSEYSKNLSTVFTVFD